LIFIPNASEGIVVDNFTAGDAMEIEEVIGQQKQNKPDEFN